MRFGKKLAAALATATLATIGVVGMAAPAEAANPYGQYGVCGGTGWKQVDHHQLYKQYYWETTRTTVADVYLMYRGGYNCVATIKRTEVGSPTYVNSRLTPQGKSEAMDYGWNIKYYTAVVAYAPGCIKWGGTAEYNNFTGDNHDWTSSGWSHCG